MPYRYAIRALALLVTSFSVTAQTEVKLTAADGAMGDLFGSSVAVDGDTAVIGAYDDDDGGSTSGSAYVFSRDQGGTDMWGQIVKLTADDAAAADRFGWSVAVDGDTAAVGAYQDDDDGIDSGSAYVFSRNQGGADMWGQVVKLTADDAAAADRFGWSVAVDGDTAAVGAYQDDDDGMDSGSAYVFSRDQGGADMWGQVGKLTAADAAAFDYFGYSVAVDGDTALVGAFSEGLGGSAYVFSRNEGGANMWGQVAKLTAADAAGTDYFGYSVAVDGDTAVIGAYRDDDNGSTSGSAYVFSRDQGGVDMWGQVAKLTAADGFAGDRFGYSVAVDGNTAVIGAYDDDDGGSTSGSAYVFSRDQGGADMWGQVGKLTAADAAADDGFGWSVAVDGDTAVFGAYGDDDDGDSSGSAYVMFGSPVPVELQHFAVD
ncbi:MAG: hypothetical protein DHS20C11_20740 [Lysobacteraceae bacterium]|nr:MAG: hypothetical protein DHS20C11_20740 [Xanthomonadaceae bacterium]